jgi:signal transduction histidine kinase
MSDRPGAENDPRDMSHDEIALLVHELRGTLTVIAGYTALLAHGLDRQETAAALSGIERAISRADSLCADAVAGRTPASAATRVRERVDVRELAQQIAADQTSATGRDVAVHCNAPAGLAVLGDPLALARVLTNVVGNAAKYSPNDAPVEVVVTQEQQPFLGAMAVIDVCDRGPGIPEKMRERVFEPFERLCDDPDTPGTGLGLAVVRSIVLAHDGVVTILDREDGGTIVRVELPAAMQGS